jgi:Zn-dependent peptidase ImmA (M78 family)
VKGDDSTLTYRQLTNVQRHADRLLRDAGAYGRFPTPVDDLLAAAKLKVVDDELLDDGLLRRFLRKATMAGVAALKSALSKVVGLFDAADRLVLIDKTLPRPRIPFVKLHEAGHGSLPHQSRVYALIHDCLQTLDPDTTDLFEREANVFASEVMFQRVTFFQQAHDQEFGLKVPMGLAKQFGASNYATFRRYVGTSPRACCLIVLEPVRRRRIDSFTVEIRRIVASRTFHEMYDALRFGTEINENHALAPGVPLGRRMIYPRQIALVDRNGDTRECTVEAFDTTHQVLILVLDTKPFTRRGVVLPKVADIAALFRKVQMPVD